MATLEEVLAALDSATTDAREVLTKIPQIATTNGDVPFTFADGTQITLPGLPKLKAEVDGFIAGAETTIQSWWNRTLYVDAVNGDDSNPGTSDAPFKTIGKAIYTTPIGGYASIYLKEGQVHEITATNGIGINRKSIIFKRWGDSTSAVIRRTGQMGFQVQNSYVRIAAYIDIECPNSVPSAPVHWNVFFKCHNDYGSSTIVIGDWNSTGEDLNTIKTDVRLFDSENVTSQLVLYNVSVEGLDGNYSESPLKIVSGMYILSFVNSTYDSTVFAETVSSNTIPGGV